MSNVSISRNDYGIGLWPVGIRYSRERQLYHILKLLYVSTLSTLLSTLHRSHVKYSIFFKLEKGKTKTIMLLFHAKRPNRNKVEYCLKVFIGHRTISSTSSAFTLLGSLFPFLPSSMQASKHCNANNNTSVEYSYSRFGY